MKGLFRKFIVTKVNGEPVNSFKFVLSPEKDKADLEALRQYAFKTENEELANDLFNIISKIEGNESK